LQDLPKGVDTVVSLCRVGDQDVPQGISHVEFRLIDSEMPGENPHLDFVLSGAANIVARLRQDGWIVFLHCVAFSRTPTVAVLYGTRLRGVSIDEALTDVCGTARRLPKPRIPGRAATAAGSATVRFRYANRKRLTWRAFAASSVRHCPLALAGRTP
jgi:hypothetical protein